MKCNVFANGKHIGQAILNGRDSGMGVYVGRFEPTSAYNGVRPVFLLYTECVRIRENTGQDDEKPLRQFFEERDRLNLSIRRLDNVVIPTSWVLIADFLDEVPADELEIQIQVSELGWLDLTQNEGAC